MLITAVYINNSTSYIFVEAAEVCEQTHQPLHYNVTVEGTSKETGTHTHKVCNSTLFVDKLEKG